MAKASSNRYWIGLVLLCGATATLAHAQPCTNTSFAQRAGSPVSTGDGPQSVAVGDLNGDGRIDLATANYESGNVTILLNQSDGVASFTQPAGSPVAAGAGAGSVAMGDFNGDGKPDLAVANLNAHNVTILLGDGTGGFTQPAGSPLSTGGIQPSPVIVGNFNGDNNVDLAVVNQGSSTVTILLGNGAGGFTQPAGSPSLTLGDGPFSAAAGDFNGGTKPDLVVTHIFTENMTVLLGDGSGGFFEPAGSPAYFIEGPTSVAAGDFNRDGKLDAAVTSVGMSQDTVAILLGNGDGTFTQSAIPAAGTPFSVAIGDFNRDGKLDLATANIETHELTVLLGDDAAFIELRAAPHRDQSARATNQGIGSGGGRCRPPTQPIL